MTITIEIGENRIEVETEKEARKLLRKAMKEQVAADRKRSEDYRQAKILADAAAYRVLARKLGSEDFPRGWRLYLPHDQWYTNLCKPVTNAYSRDYQAAISTEPGVIILNHYGNSIVGAVCNGAGFCFCLFLRDNDRPEQEICYAVGACGETIALSECPTIKREDFPTKD